MAKQYNFENIRALLTEGFTDQELRHLCFDMPAFKPVYAQLARGSGKSEIVQQLLEYVEQKELIETLLDQAKERNPVKYKKYQPYYEVTPIPTISKDVYETGDVIPIIHNLSQSKNLFIQGCESFEHALNALENKNFPTYETKLQGAARDVSDALEWALKIYLENFPGLDLQDRRKLDKPTFHDLMVLMEKYANPPLEKATRIELSGYRAMRNKITHQGAIPPIEEVQNAITGIRRIILTYLPVEAKDLPVEGVDPLEGSRLKMPPEFDEYIIARIKRLERQLKELQKAHDLLNEKISLIRQGHVIALDPAEKFRLEKHIEQAEAERDDYEQKMANIEAQIEQLRRSYPRRGVE